jgi:hypothetical protein
MNSVPFLSYAYSPDFDYRKYCEARSHATEIVQAVDRGMLQLAYSNDRIEKQISTASAEVVRSIVKGFDAVSDGFFEVKSAVDAQTSIIVDGISGLSQGLVAIENELVNIGRYLANPETTWAYEQYRLARKAADNLLVSEALHLLEIAIDGYGSHPGHKLDYRFHYLKGHCLMGCPPATVSEQLDLDAARDAFELAARYAVLADGETKTKVAICLTKSAWVAYLQGDFAMAEDRFQKAWQNFHYPEAAYIAAKTYLAQSKKGSAEPYLFFCIFADQDTVGRMSSDPDFIRHRSLVERVKRQVQSIFSNYVADAYLPFKKAHQILTASGVLKWQKSFASKSKGANSTSSLTYLERFIVRSENAAHISIADFGVEFNGNHYPQLISELQQLKANIADRALRDQAETKEYKRLQAYSSDLSSESRKKGEEVDVSSSFILSALLVYFPLNAAFVVYAWQTGGMSLSGWFLGTIEVIFLMLFMPIVVLVQSSSMAVVYFCALVSFGFLNLWIKAYRRVRIKSLDTAVKHQRSNIKSFYADEITGIENALHILASHKQHLMSLKDDLINKYVTKEVPTFVRWITPGDS